MLYDKKIDPPYNPNVVSVGEGDDLQEMLMSRGAVA